MLLKHHRVILLVLLLPLFFLGMGGVWLQRGPHLADAASDWPDIALQLVADGFTKPVYVTHAGDGSGRLFVVENGGRIKIVDGANPPLLFLDISEKVSTGYEQGLLSVAFPADYEKHGYFYVDYTNLEGDSIIARYKVSAVDPNRADPESERVILSVEQPGEIHNGGQLHFGPQDGYLYVSLGDGGGQGDPFANGQDPGTLLGTILRLEVPLPAVSGDFTPTHRVYLPSVAQDGQNRAYRIPASNPFTQTVGYRDEIWAWGFRNPWRFSFDRETGDLYIGDVGQDTYEEVNFQSATSSGGENYGWPIMEGFHCYDADTCDTNGLTLPILEHHHEVGNSVTGGYVYRGDAYPALQGIYVFGDFVDGIIWGARREQGSWVKEVLTDTSYFLSSFGEDEAGNLYVVNYAHGAVYEIVVP